MATTEEHVRISVRVPAEQVGALERIAAQEDRTLSGEIRRLIRLYLTEATEPQRLEAA